MTEFRHARSSAATWSDAVAECIAGLRFLPDGANLGFVYATDIFAADLAAITDRLRLATGVGEWVGTVGYGVSGSAVGVFDKPGLSVLIGAFPLDSFRVFAGITKDLDDFRSQLGGWMAKRRPSFGVVHVDPRNARLPELVRGLAEAGSCYLVGGLTASRAVPAQVASRQGEVRLVQGGLSGVLFSDEVAVAAGLTQGCTPIGPVHQITAAEENVIQAIDNEPALDVFKRDVGELLARDLRRVAGYIHAAIPVTGSDTGDYLVRNLAGIDPKRGWIAIAEYVNPGDRVLFCRRDGQSAAEDLGRMLNQLKRRGNAPPKGGLYFSCVARGPHMFGDESAEQSRIEGELGSFPLSGFYANGEICNDRLYGYTGVLALFLA